MADIKFDYGGIFEQNESCPEGILDNFHFSQLTPS